MIDAFHRRTIYVMASAVLLAVLVMMAPTYAVYYNKNWGGWSHGFPLQWIAIGVSYMAVFFHELGHGVAYWLYGVIAVPAFNLAEGGGVTMPLTQPFIILHVVLYGVLLYVMSHYRQKSVWVACIGLAAFQVLTFYAGWYQIIVGFAGALAESVIAGFMLWRAWFNQAPRGLVERFLNGFFGFALGFQALIQSWALVHDVDVQHVYQDNAGSVLVQDFNRLADLTGWPFPYMVNIWFWVTVMCMVAPLCHYILWRVQLSQLIFQSRFNRGD